MASRYITIEIDDLGEKIVLRKDYIRAKTRDLRSFGYSDLTEDEVSVQLDKILAGADDNDLSIIGRFMQKDIVVPKTED